DHTRALELARAVVAERGEQYRYLPPGGDGLCVYADAGAPSCLVGHVLHRAGITVDELDEMNGEIGNGEMSERLRLDSDAVELLRHMQEQQDAGAAWGYA